MTFTLKIELGNDAMQTPADVWEAIGQMLKHDTFESVDPWSEDKGRIMDINGNSVGSWEVK